MAERQLDLYMSMNENQVRELKAIHYKFIQLFKGAEMRSGMDEALVVVDNSL